MSKPHVNFNRGRKTLLQILFGRTGVVVLMLLAQIAFIVSIVFVFNKYIIWIYGVSILLSAVLVVYIFNRNDNPAFKMTWIIPILVIPIFGALMYLFVRLDLGTRMPYKKLSALIADTSLYLPQNKKTLSRLEKEDFRAASTARYIARCGGYPVYEKSDVVYFPSGEDKLKELLIQLGKAERFILLEYFIIEEGHMWNEVFKILCRKAEQGVDVKVLYDGTCSIALLPYSYPKKLRTLGIECKMFNPIKPFLTTIQNNRDHRKIVVIDGKVAFTGGINLADEYINRTSLFGHWKDTAVMVKGEAVRSFTVMFLQMWYVSEKPPYKYKTYFSEEIIPVKQRAEEGFVIPFADSPLDGEPIGKSVYFDIISTAKRYVHITTPYLILDNEMLYTLTLAAKSGKDIKIIMPGIPDKRFIYYLGRTYYKQLLAAGVRIFEYTPGFIHAKMFTSDDNKAVVGTINLDYRSLYLHFECACYMYGCAAVGDVERDFQATLGKCREITMKEYKQYPWIKRVTGHVLRLFAPLM